MGLLPSGALSPLLHLCLAWCPSPKILASSQPPYPPQITVLLPFLIHAFSKQTLSYFVQALSQML